MSEQPSIVVLSRGPFFGHPLRMLESTSLALSTATPWIVRKRDSREVRESLPSSSQRSLYESSLFSKSESSEEEPEKVGEITLELEVSCCCLSISLRRCFVFLNIDRSSGIASMVLFVCEYKYVHQEIIQATQQ